MTPAIQRVTTYSGHAALAFSRPRLHARAARPGGNIISTIDAIDCVLSIPLPSAVMTPAIHRVATYSVRAAFAFPRPRLPARTARARGDVSSACDCGALLRRREQLPLHGRSSERHGWRRDGGTTCSVVTALGTHRWRWAGLQRRHRRRVDHRVPCAACCCARGSRASKWRRCVTWRRHRAVRWQGFGNSDGVETRRSRAKPINARVLANETLEVLAECATAG